MNIAALINTPFQRGERTNCRGGNRFNGFPRTRETVETVSTHRHTLNTLLKQGVIENPWFSVIAR